MYRLSRKRHRAKNTTRAAVIETLELRQFLTAVAFTINPALSTLALSGSININGNNIALAPQSAGSLATSYSGTINADVESNSIQFSNTSAANAQNNGIWAPGPLAGNYGATVAAPAGSIPLAVRGLVAAGSSPSLTFGPNGTFSSASESFAITAGELDYTAQTNAAQALIGLTSTNGAATAGSYVVSQGQAKLTLPISVTYTTTTLTTNDTTLTLSGTIDATATAPVITGSISGNVTTSTGGVPGVTMYVDANNNGMLDKTEVSTPTDSSGNYLLTGFASGNLIVRQILPAAYQQLSPTRGFGIHLSLPAGQSAVNEDFLDATASNYISGVISAPSSAGYATVTVYADLNNNGKLDLNEPTTTTDTAGWFSLGGLNPGNYIVRQVVPAGYNQVTPANNFGVHTVSTQLNMQPFAHFSNTALTAPAASISGTVFSDFNGNGKLDTGETGLIGFTLYLDLSNTHIPTLADPSTTTDINGNFAFTAVAPGNYIVRTTNSPGWIQTTPANNFGWHITLSAGKTVANILFGELSDD